MMRFWNTMPSTANIAMKYTQAALDAPRFCWTDGLRFDMEPSFPHAVVDALRRRGHEIRVLSGGQYGRGQMILRAGESWAGATEPRADGSVIGF